MWAERRVPPAGRARRGLWLFGRLRVREIGKAFWAEFGGRVSQRERYGISKLFSTEREGFKN